MSYKLDSIITEYLIEIGENQSNKHARFRQFGVNFLRRTNLDTSGFPRIVELKINDNDTADLPEDYVNYTKIALSSGGKLISLGVNNSIALGKQYDSCGRPVSNAPALSASMSVGILASPLMVADNYRNGEFVGRLFGLSSDFNTLGEYRIDKAANQIKFSGLARTVDIVLEYLSDLSAIDGDFDVHAFAIEALKDYMAWQYKVRSSKPLGEQQMAHELFKISNRNMKHRFMSSTLEEWKSGTEFGNQQTPKMG